MNAAVYGMAALALGLAGARQAPPSPHVVRLDTTAGTMAIAVDLEHAPVTGCNFIKAALRGAYTDGSFFRTVVAATNANPNPIDVIQAATVHGSDDASQPPIPLERTRDTGLRHTAGAVSMARDGPDTATTSFFVVTQDTPSLDFGGGRNPDGQGFGVFGHLIEGLDVARRIQALPATDEQINEPVLIRAAHVMGPTPTQCGL
ncbi:peptidylprolyl isomerase [Brevundimonas sp. M20]|uniref:peptidylprolyl isomerase n=1 Tax=Brevundimonas sp. M20 TaxID=2591463 RepID=UPI001146AAFC|nr:peptidylprolyl isomerase [Brevundimonas sp. M20]QDH73765.1 peptidylprolyl isomerase [Brevundimonas sp. M20]